MNTEGIFQVNVHYEVNDEVWGSIVPYSQDGYQGQLIDTVYSDGCSYTDWCAYVGTREECEEFLAYLNY